MLPKISVIVPVYNVEKYLHRCIDSILSQTFTDFELLLIDDGSKDKSGVICDEYAVKDKRVRVFHRENGGATLARATGVDKSKADWVTFVDSDDELDSCALKQFASKISDNSDIILGFHEVVIVTNNTMPIEQYRANCIAGFRIAPWAKLFRKSLFSFEIFDIPREIVLGEDWIMNIRLAFASQKNVEILSNLNNVYHYKLDNENRCTSKNRHTLESEKKFLQYYNMSIPQNFKDRYIQSVCEANMFLVLCLLESSYRTPIEKTDSYRFLLSKWRQSGFTIKKLIKLILCYSIITRYFLMKFLRNHKG